MQFILLQRRTPKSNFQRCLLKHHIHSHNHSHERSLLIDPRHNRIKLNSETVCNPCVYYQSLLIQWRDFVGLLPDSLSVPETWCTLDYLPIYQRTNGDKHVHGQGEKMTQLLGVECQKHEHSDVTYAETDITYKLTKFPGLSCTNIALLSADSV